ncbi:hypothetical protein ACFV2H_10230 [Streptomyces sp. NPDC059629]|uniref:hypothetical protein n=1 Tax=Streptomyces sp. NPDC059629 TaxID=3346889 RepID=UPI00369FAEBB
MKIAKRLGAVAATTAALVGFVGTVPAAAAADSVHRGSTTCFNWSWGDGTVTWTVYAHNTCGSTKGLDWTTSTGAEACMWVAGGAKEHHVYPDEPKNNTWHDVSSCPPGTGD